MAVPKRKQTPSRTGMRRAQNMKFSSKNVVEDKKSGEYRLSHHLDLKTQKMKKYFKNFMILILGN